MQNLKSLIGKLNETCRNALEGAAGMCLSRTNYEVDIEHLLLKLLEGSNTDLHKIFDRFEVDISRLSKDLTRTIDTFKTGNARTPALSPRLPKLISDAWLIGSVDYDSPRIRSGFLLQALLASPDFSSLIRDSSKELALISRETLQKEFANTVTGSMEDKEAPAAAAQAGAAKAGVPAGTKALDQFTIDLTERARKGEIDPVMERDMEIRQMIDILTRRRQNNPILTGEAGVGKTAVVEGFALRIAEKDVPPPLLNVSLRVLDLGLLQAGAGIKGEFENRLKSVIDEVKASPQPVILFIDEAHTMIGAGGQAGQNDAANLLKPALARGELRTIAATTWSEYKKYFEKDAALARRFQVIKVDEPTPEKAVIMMRHLVPKLEKHHNVRVLEEAVENAVNLSDRYITGRQLPDKAVSVLDTACARLAIGQTAVPAEVEDLRRRLTHISLEIEILEREQLTGQDKQEQLDELRKTCQSAQSQLTEAEGRWEKEKQLVERIRDLRSRIEAQAKEPEQAAAGATDAKEAPPSLESLRHELQKLNEELKALQGEKPLLQVVVDAQTVADVISGWTGIPVGKMMRNEIETVLSLQERLSQRVIGQSHALEGITHRIQTSRARMEDPRRPIGVFLLVGPSGVGKTETALTLADTLYGGERNLVTINMSEYQEAHTVSSLKGSPPGYVGYGEGGVLTEAVRRKPYSVVLLDEVEKAHADVLELFFQVFDKGMMEDAEGREIDFKNTVILLTSNVGTDLIMKLCADEETRPEPDKLVESLRPELQKHFKPAFLGRLIVIPYYPIGDSIMRDIVRLQLDRIARRVRQNHRAEFSYDDRLVEAVRSRCTEVDSGARNVDHILTRTLLPEMSKEVLSRMAAGQALSKVRITADAGGNFVYELS